MNCESFHTQHRVSGVRSDCIKVIGRRRLCMRHEGENQPKRDPVWTVATGCTHWEFPLHCTSVLPFNVALLNQGGRNHKNVHIQRECWYSWRFQHFGAGTRVTHHTETAPVIPGMGSFSNTLMEPTAYSQIITSDPRQPSSCVPGSWRVMCFQRELMPVD